MKTHKRIFNNLAFFIAMFIILLSAVPKTEAQDYCTPTLYYVGQFMGINEFYLEDLSMDKSWNTSGYTHDTKATTTLSPGETYDWKAAFCNQGSWCYEQMFFIWVDWNQDGKFSDDELTYSSDWDEVYSDYKGTITVPNDAKAGKTRFRIMSDYWYVWEWYGYSEPWIDPCEVIEYGEVVDFDITIAPKAPDASVSAIIHPELPMAIGINSISATIKSNNQVNINNVYVHWSVNGVEQPSKYWTGNLLEGEEANVYLGDYNFLYPIDGPFNPYNVVVWTQEPNGFDPDASPLNDSRTASLNFVLNDAGISDIVTPSGNYTPGPQPITARIKNYGPRRLTMADIHWSVDGVNQNTVKWEGNLAFNEYTDVFLGYYDIQYKTPISTYEVQAWTGKPNNFDDLLTYNDKFTRLTAPSLIASKFYVGGVNPHFFTLAEFSTYLTASGVIGDGTVEVIIRPGSYSGPIVLDNFPYADNKFIFRSESEQDNSVRILHSHQGVPYGEYILVSNGIDNVEFHNISFVANNASKIARITNSKDFLFDRCIFRSIPTTNKNFNDAVLHFSEVNGINISNSRFFDGSVSLWVQNASDEEGENEVKNSIYVRGNTFTNFSYAGLHITDTDLSINSNRFYSISAGSKTGLYSNGNTGYIANNFITGRTIFGADLVNSDNLYFLYNTVYSEGQLNNSVSINSGVLNLYRNMLLNSGEGNAISITGSTDFLTFNANENNYFSDDQTFNFLGEKSNVLADWIIKTGADDNSRNIKVGVESTQNPRILRLDNALVTATPLDIPDWYSELAEANDYYGNQRRLFIIGAEELLLIPQIRVQPIDVISCVGETGHFVSVAANLAYDAIPEYQWYLDGQEVIGAINPILHLPALNFEHSGVYMVKVMAPFGIDWVYSEPVTVYVVGETEIVEQPKNAYGTIGETAIFTVKAHARFLPPDNTFDYQWYRYNSASDAMVPLNNDMNYTGVHSDQLVISRIATANYTNNNDYYAVEVRGKCGTVMSGKAYLDETPQYGIRFVEEPQSDNTCSDEYVNLSVVAEPYGESMTLTYQWFKDGELLNDNNTFSGSQTSNLTIASISDNETGDYYVNVFEAEGETTTKSKTVTIGILEPVEIVKQIDWVMSSDGQWATLRIEAKGEEIDYNWYKNGELMKEFGGLKTITLNLKSGNNFGDWKAIASNKCGEASSIVTITQHGGIVSYLDAITVNELVPNPASTEFRLNYETNEIGATRIVVRDVTGREQLSINRITNEGLNSISVDVSNLPVGMYYVEIHIGKNMQSTPVMIVR